MTMPERNEITAEKEEFKLNDGYYIGNHKVADFEPYVSKKYIIKDLASDIETVSYDIKVKKQEGGESKALRVTDFLKIDYFRDFHQSTIMLTNFDKKMLAYKLQKEALKADLASEVTVRAAPGYYHLNDEPIYDIFFANDFNSLPELLAGQGIADRRVCIVTESNVAPLYLDEIRNQLDGKCKELISIIFEAGESQKNLDTVKMIYEKLILAKFDRKDLLVALGGGVTGDITGFTAATYLRGIDFVQIPTSLLAQVDSSIGGKTGVDFDSYKNMVGAFHMPKLVYINVSTLTTLSDEQFISGMGEIIKHGLIKDSAYFDWLIENHDRILARDKDVLMEMIRVSCNIKRVVVENDPTEKGDRALLNFGHTLGHAIERYLDLKLSHGACVGIGCCLASVISYNRGDITEDELHKIIHAFDMFGFPTLKDYPVDADAVIEYTKNDKKMVGDKIKFILLHTIGDAYINTNVVPDDMKKAFEWH